MFNVTINGSTVTWNSRSSIYNSLKDEFTDALDPTIKITRNTTVTLPFTGFQIISGNIFLNEQLLTTGTFPVPTYTKVDLTTGSVDNTRIIKFLNNGNFQTVINNTTQAYVPQITNGNQLLGTATGVPNIILQVFGSTTITDGTNTYQR